MTKQKAANALNVFKEHLPELRMGCEELATEIDFVKQNMRDHGLNHKDLNRCNDLIILRLQCEQAIETIEAWYQEYVTEAK